MAERVKIKQKSHANFTRPYLDGLLRIKPDVQQTIWDTKQRGLCVLHSSGLKKSPTGTVTFRCYYYTPDKPGAPQTMKIGRYGETVFYRDADGKLLSLDCNDVEAVRLRCSNIRNAAKAGVDPKQERLSGDIGELVGEYVNFIKRRGKKNKSVHETQRIFDVYVLPEWRTKNIHDLTRSEVTKLLNNIADGLINHKGRKIGTRTVAAMVYARISGLFKWYDDLHGENLQHLLPKKLTESWAPESRGRELTDAEIRALWEATAELGFYGACVRTALLVAQRFKKVMEMRRSEIQNGIWDARIDGGKGDPFNKKVAPVPLSAFALEVINSAPVIDAGKGSSDFIFTFDGKKAFTSYVASKEKLDKRMSEILGTKVEYWQHRDLRRTARTLMSRAGVKPDIAERCLAHLPPLMVRVYDVYNYAPEMREAFQRLSDLVEHILSGGDREDWQAKKSGSRRAA